MIEAGGSFTSDPAVENTLVEQYGIWFGDEATEFVLEVAREVAGCFRRRAVIANQSIVKELQDGGLIVSAKVGHPNQILPHVRYWIPHLRIISPHGMQRQLDAELSAYLASMRTVGANFETRTS